MKRPKFVRVIAAPLPRATTDTPGFRRKDDVLPVGSIVPGEWFRDTPDAVFVYLINPPKAGGMGVLEEFEPGTAELAVLREFYPTAFAALTPSPSPEDRGELTAEVEVTAKRKTRSTEKDGE